LTPRIRSAVLRCWSARDYDVVLMDLNYARDTTSGQEGLDLVSEIRATDDATAARRDDRVGIRAARG
jgi:hypothetical protein